MSHLEPQGTPTVRFQDPHRTRGCLGGRERPLDPDTEDGMERGGAGFQAPTLAFTLASPGVCKTNSCPEVCPCTKRRDACDGRTWRVAPRKGERLVFHCVWWQCWGQRGDKKPG